MHMRRKQWLITGLVLSLTIMACDEEKKPEAPRRGRGGGPVQAEGFIVRTTSLSENIEVPGTLLPFEVTEIRSEISGRVTSLNIPEGSYVQQGALLVKLFDGDLQAQLQKLQVQLQIALRLCYFIAYIIGSCFKVNAQVKFHVDAGTSLAAGRSDISDAGNTIDRFFEGLRQLRFHDIGIGAGITYTHVDVGRIDGWIIAYAEVRKTNHAEQYYQYVHHGCQYRSPQTQLRDVHKLYLLLNFS